tara:strand:+ start:738 stop:902 length:165 start_codon:yes stop_codon:yes gene_type:complete
MTHILVTIGSPSGSTNWRNGSIIVQVPHGFEGEFADAIEEYARVFAKDYSEVVE